MEFHLLCFLTKCDSICLSRKSRLKSPTANAQLILVVFVLLMRSCHCEGGGRGATNTKLARVPSSKHTLENIVLITLSNWKEYDRSSSFLYTIFRCESRGATNTKLARVPFHSSMQQIIQETNTKSSTHALWEIYSKLFKYIEMNWLLSIWKEYIWP